MNVKTTCARWRRSMFGAPHGPMFVVRRRKTRAAIFVAALCVAPLVLATTLMRMSLEQLASSADTIVRGRCISVSSRWEDGAIWTIGEVDVADALKGMPQAHIRVRSPGGRVGHIVSHVDSVPKLAPGDERVLFLERNRFGDYSVTAWAAGTFRINRDAEGVETVTQQSADIPVFNPVTRQFHTDGIRNFRFSEFRRRIMDAAAQQPHLPDERRR